ncbi:MAG: hypothetical protein K2K45_07650 [Muribaculaceae bacterium]|nr:hypothetical protein [Muribaculaceae bacterium]
MTDEDIRKLAREYWDSQNPINQLNDYPEAKMIADMMQSVLSSHIEELVEDYAKFLKWLSDRFCIVEKEKVKNFLELSEVHALDAIDAVEFIEDVFGSELF